MGPEADGLSSDWGRYAHDELRLENVLHVPGFRFNVVGGGILTKYGWRYDSHTPYKNQDSCIIGGRDLQVCYMRHISGLPCIRLSGPPNGPVISPSRLEADTVYGVKDMRWPEEERRWFENFGAKIASGQNPKSRTQPKVSMIEFVATDEHSDKPYYTSEEKAWLKKYYGNEFKFLRTYGLSIYKEDQRAEGRHLARSLMAPDEEDVLPELIDPEPAAETPPDPPEDKKKKSSRGGEKNHNVKVHQQVIDAGLGANAAKISSVDANRNVKVSSNVVTVEPEKVKRAIQNIEPGKNEGKNKKKDENPSGGVKIDVGRGVNNSKSINGNDELNVVDGSQVKIERVQALPKTAQIGEEKGNNERKSELELANDDTTGGGGAPLY